MVHVTRQPDQVLLLLEPYRGSLLHSEKKPKSLRGPAESGNHLGHLPGSSVFISPPFPSPLP